MGQFQKKPCAVSAGLSVAGRGEDDGIASGETFRHGAIAGEAGGEFLHLAALTFTGWHGGERLVTAGLNAEIIVGFLRQARFSPSAFQRRLGNGDAGREIRLRGSLPGGSDGGG